MTRYHVVIEVCPGLDRVVDVLADSAEHAKNLALGTLSLLQAMTSRIKLISFAGREP